MAEVVPWPYRQDSRTASSKSFRRCIRICGALQPSLEDLQLPALVEAQASVPPTSPDQRNRRTRAGSKELMLAAHALAPLVTPAADQVRFALRPLHEITDNRVGAIGAEAGGSRSLGRQPSP